MSPILEGGRFAAKAVVGQPLRVAADVIADGHDIVAADLLWRPAAAAKWDRAPMLPVGNDRMAARFVPALVGPHEFAIEAWIDRYGTFAAELPRRTGTREELRSELEWGAELLRGAAKCAIESGHTADADALEKAAQRVVPEELVSAPLVDLARLHDPRTHHASTETYPVHVDRPLAAHGAWYEMFPRSASGRPGRHGTLADVQRQLPRLEEMGFDVLYLPPIHPIGSTARKGPNNAARGGRNAVGSPWAIGSAEGGHTAINPALGNADDLKELVAACGNHHLELALDIAFQCSPDHPWVTEHPSWFRHRSDGTVRHAENPPKRYEDIYPLDFESADWEQLWCGLRDVFLHWMDFGVRVFRVDNPHTKSLAFWAWVVAELRDRDPGVILLSEAFTRPKLMARLARLGFTQSYTYFTWRTTAWEMRQYVEELQASPLVHELRPNFWPNTPDILPLHLQAGGRPAFIARAVLAATLSPNYGIYGPAYELMEHTPAGPGREEYLDSEKYQLRHWNWTRADSLAPVLARLNHARRSLPCLQHFGGTQFHDTGNSELLAYSRVHESGDPVLVVVSFDHAWAQSGFVHVAESRLGLEAGQEFTVEDLLDGAFYHWSGDRHFVELSPDRPAHVLRVRR